MAGPHSRLPAKRGAPLPRLWIDPNLSSPELPTPPSASSPERTSLATSSEETLTPESAEVFYVLCLYDYNAEDGSQLSFRRNDILEVVKKEETGWWAAVRPEDDTVGWIPSAFVEPISDALADKLRNSGGNVQIYQEDADRFQGSPDSQLTDPFAVGPDGEQRGYEWMPLVDGEKVPTIMQLGSDPAIHPSLANVLSPLVPPHEGIDGNFLEIESELSPTEVAISRRKARPRPTLEEDGAQVITVSTPPPTGQSPMPSTPRTPSRRRSLSLPSGEIVPSEHQRSRSESAKPAVVRHMRRRPLLIDDQSSLSRLTTLFEAHNVEELDYLIASPVVAESFDAFTRTTRAATSRPDKVKQITGDDEAQAFHDAKVVHGTWYLRPMYGEDELQLQPDGAVSAGSLRALVERLTVDFPKPVQETKYRQAFLTTYKSFATAEEVFDLLLAQFNISHPTALNLKELEQWKERRLKPTRRRVLAVLHLWIEEYGLLQDDAYLARRIVDFVSSITKPPQLANTAREVLKSLERYISNIPATPVSATRHKRSKGSKGDLLKIDTLLLAEHLCIHEQKLYSRIRVSECLNWVKSPAGNGVKHLAAFNAFNEKLCAWVKTSILNTESTGKRADTIDFWIKIAEKCKTLHNYASMYALVDALSSPVVSRLHLTWAHVGRRSHLEQLAKYHDPTGSFSAYRLSQRAVDGPCIPYIGMHLADMQAANTQAPDNTVILSSSSTSSSPLSLINFAKRERWYEAIEAIVRHQPRTYAFAEDASVVAYVDANIAVAGEKDQGSFWMKSQELQQAELQHADIRKGLELAGF
ncbi:ras GEF [Trametes versicolor FP-101664 SS1]|uniref:ras GEF n=1 Tax=Trametes versicolor (strain FP-101664) TaxID=717944 RepID=UPI0004621931|nr:ras GEF [Trametes versicolor FP-101664 SS1]EIW64034.1 ras GEF [Trametes versicolor FP-101664 SS1]